MSYLVTFKNGKSTTVLDEEHENIVKFIEEGKANAQSYMGFTKGFILLSEICYTEKLGAYNEQGTVVTPPKPDSVAEQRRKEKEKIKSNPSAILNRTKEKYKEDEPST